MLRLIISKQVIPLITEILFEKMEKISDILDVSYLKKGNNLSDVFTKGDIISLFNTNNINKKEKIIGMCLFVNNDYLILLHKNKLKIFSKEGKYKISELDMTLLNLYRLYGYKLDGYIYSI